MFPDFPVQNPFETCECITQASYDAFFDHDLGNDCIANSFDDPSSNENPVFDHVEGRDQCNANEEFNPDACACYKTDPICDINCAELFPTAPVKNPLEHCECISIFSFDELFAHGLVNCGADDGSGTGTGGIGNGTNSNRH